MEEIVARAVLEVMQAMKQANAGSDNQLLRELKAIHSNTTMGDLPEHLQKAIRSVAQGMFGHINRHQFVLVPKEKSKR